MQHQALMHDVVVPDAFWAAYFSLSTTSFACHDTGGAARGWRIQLMRWTKFGELVSLELLQGQEQSNQHTLVSKAGY